MLEPQVLLTTPAWIALNKPSGWLVHPVGTAAPDLVTWAATNGLGRLRPAHRLDLDTSGVIVLARNAAAAGELGRAFMAATVAKEYLALVYDAWTGPAVLDAPLADARRGRPLPAVTRVEVAEALGRFTLLRLRPETGRKHQLRRHLHGAGHPIVGDTEYPVRPFRKVPGYPQRLWLHAEAVTLPGALRVVAPLTPELAAHRELLRGASPA